MQIEIPHGWNPRNYQLPLWKALESGTKRAVAVWHRRAGKDSLSLNWTATQALQRPGVYWHMAPTQKQVRKIVWDNIDYQGRRIIDQVFPKELRSGQKDNEMQITLKNGSIWQCVGSDNYDSLVGANPVGVVFSEYSIADPKAWDYVRPILAENGGWALFIYTPRGPNHGKDMYDMAYNDPNWFAQILTVEDTGVLTPNQVDDERKAGMSDAMIQQEFYCSFSGIVDGSYYGTQIQQLRANNQITRIPHEPTLPVSTAWDLGVSDDTAIWFYQKVGLEIRVLHYYENRGAGIAHYANYLKEKPYSYDTHHLPHDAGHTQMATGTSISKQLQALTGVRCQVSPREQSLAAEVGVQAVRDVLPKCWFDYEGCKDGLKKLELYRRQYDDKREVFKDKPLHDFTSHAADAFRELAKANKLTTARHALHYQHNYSAPSHAISDYDVFG